jgi:hypothetical protein
MTGLAPITSTLQRLPANVRRTLYTIVSIAGVLLLVAQQLEWAIPGPLSVNDLLQAYTLLSPAVGVVAVANVSGQPPAVEDFGQDLDEDDFDVTSFDPIATDEFV